MEADASQRSKGGLSREDFTFGSLLGEGAFARVLVARHHDGGEYAIKMVDKKTIQVRDRSSGVLTERTMLLNLDHPGIVRLHFAFQDDWALYFGLELVPGGELASQIQRMGRCTTSFTCFYIAEIVSILGYLRSKRVAHRDLKPENLLLTSEGRLKLVDFDAAMYVPEGEADAAAGQPENAGAAVDFVGTALYVAPEVILGTVKPHQAFALDFWALGCIIYLMLVGKTPFHAESEYLVFERIQNADYKFPEDMNREAQMLTEALLSKVPQRRPGAEGIGELQRHPFFGGSQASFDELRRQTPPPRITRLDRRRGQDLGSVHEDTMDNLPSSSECTPEVGQSFWTRRAEVLLGEQADAFSTDSEDESDDKDSPQFCLAVRPAAFAATLGAEPEVKEKRPSARRRRSPGNGYPGNCHGRKPHLGRPSPQWLQDLLHRRVLFRGEDVCLSGKVVQRFFPCLRPRMLVLTNLPRLLLLDSKGRRLVKDVDLLGSASSRVSSMSTCLADPALNQKSRTEFELRLGGQRLRCRDHDLGAETWLDEIAAARQRLTISRSAEP